MHIFREVARRISPFMKSKGFLLSGKNYYYIENDIAYCVGFDSPGGIMYVTAYIMPLYIPCEYRYYSYGNRLNAMNDISLPLLRKDDDSEVIDQWCEMLCCCINKTIIPFFKEIQTPHKLVEYAERDLYITTARFFCPEIYIDRLKMFTYLYIHDLPMTNAVINHYRDLLFSSNFITDSIRQHFLREIDSIVTYTKCGRLDMSSYFLEIIDHTRKIIL